jgi:hypothetical protein
MTARSSDTRRTAGETRWYDQLLGPLRDKMGAETAGMAQGLHSTDHNITF